jgi:hypothetical protein
MRSDPETLKAFATFRIVGDSLQPADVTAILRTVPTRAFRKGEKYQPGGQSPMIAGKTGTWYFSTDSVVASSRLEDHLAYLVNLILTQRGDTVPLTALKDLIRKRSLKAHITLFWHGRHNAKKPALQNSMLDVFKLLPADIETDFDADGEPPRKRGASLTARA